MRTHRQRSAARRTRGGSTLCAAMAVALVLLMLATPAGALPARHSCSTPVGPGHARCLAMRLLLGTAGTAQPLATTRAAQPAGSNSKPFPGFQTPQRLRELYGLPEETPAGSAQTIALVDAFDDPTAEADLAVYSKEFGLTPCTGENGCFKKVNEKGTASPLPKPEGEWASEVSIDVQMAHAICQSCHILLVEADTEEFSDLAKGVNAAVKLGATEVSNSYGGTEESSDAETESSSYNHPGTVITASSGDCGYYNKLCPELAPGAEFPADSPHVLSVGGTSVHESAGLWTSTAWEEGGSGCSVVFNAAFWQSSVANFAATGCGSGRAEADVSAVGDPNTGVDVYDSTPEFPGGPTGWGVWGGTSVASPIVAGEFALAGGSEGVAYPAATVYGHATETSAFYDVTAGSNGKCAGTTICEATAGFDGPTGIGSPVGLGAFAISGTPKSTSPPAVSGYPEQGLALSVQPGSWTGSPGGFSYQWERCGFGGANCQTIPGATESTYTPVGEDIGHRIRVREGAFNVSGSGYEDAVPVGPVASDVPQVTSWGPATGITGSTIVVNGSALDSTAEVLVGKVAATFTAVSPLKLEVTVPDGAGKGKLTVTTAHGTVKPKGKFVASFSVTGFSPLSGAAGTTVTIKGVGFTPTSTVSFDGTPAASVTYSSAKKLRAVVPAGAGIGPITVTNTQAPAGTVASAAAFTP